MENCKIFRFYKLISRPRSYRARTVSDFYISLCELKTQFLVTDDEIAKYVGKYERVSDVDYLEFLTELGANQLIKRAATASNPVLEVTYDSVLQEWNFQTSTKIIKNPLKFVLNEEKEERTQPRRLVKTKVTKNNDIFTVMQIAVRPRQKSTVFVFEFKDSGEVHVTFSILGSPVVSKQVFKKIE